MGFGARLALAVVLAWAGLAWTGLVWTGLVWAGVEGWESGSAYGTLYKMDASDTVAGVVESVFVVSPLPDMAKGLGLVVKSQGRQVLVHLGPVDAVGYLERLVAAGDRVRVKGAWGRLGQGVFLMAAKLRIGEEIEVKLRRSRDGAPYWSLKVSERAAERLED